MRVVHGLFMALAVGTALVHADEKAPDPKVKVPPVTFPEVRAGDVPPPLPTPVTNLPAGSIYPIVSSSKLLVLDSPTGVVNVSEGKQGPFTVGGTFVNGTGEFEIRDYVAGQWVYLVTPKTKGTVELLAIKDLEPSSVFRRTISVAGGAKKPDPKDPVDPVEPVTGTTSKPIVVIAENPVNRTPAQAAVINDDAFHLFVKSKGGQVEVVSINDPAFAARNYKGYTDKVGLPTVLIFDGNATGPSAPVDYYKLPGTAGDNITRVKKVTN